MPVIVIGADTPHGLAVVAALLDREGELRAFVSDVDAAIDLRTSGVKVAIGDVSDGSHIGGAAMNTFSAVLIAAAATDNRERSFAGTLEGVITAWAEGLREARVHRALWVGDHPPDEHPIRTAVAEFAVVTTSGRPPQQIAAEVAELDEAAHI